MAIPVFDLKIGRSYRFSVKWSYFFPKYLWNNLAV